MSVLPAFSEPLVYGYVSSGLLACLPIAAMLIAFDNFFDKGENYEGFKDQISITDSKIAFGEMKSGPSVAVMVRSGIGVRFPGRTFTSMLIFWMRQGSEWMSERWRNTTFKCRPPGC